MLGIYINPKRLQAQLFHGRLAETISQLNIADPEETSILNKIARNQPVVGTATNDRLPVGSTHPMPAIQLMLLKIELRKRTPVPVAEALIAKTPCNGCGNVEAPIRDRKSDGKGKSWSERVDLGGVRRSKKKKT